MKIYFHGSVASLTKNVSLLEERRPLPFTIWVNWISFFFFIEHFNAFYSCNIFLYLISERKDCHAKLEELMKVLQVSFIFLSATCLNKKFSFIWNCTWCFEFMKIFQIKLILSVLYIFCTVAEMYFSCNLSLSLSYSSPRPCAGWSF